MGLTTSLYSAVTGLRCYGTAISVSGDNIANLNTAGFKGSRITFQDALNELIATAQGSSQVGRGVMVSDVSLVFTQGSFETTNAPTDLAINGKGLFIVREPNTQKFFYTRAGHFRLNPDGKLVNPEGYVLQGWAIGSNTLTDVVIDTAASAAKATSLVEVAVNLDARAQPPAQGFDPNVEGSWNYQTSITVYDSLGAPHRLVLYFVRTSNGWDCYVAEGTNLLNGGQPLTELQFDTNGALFSGETATLQVTFQGASGQSITFNFNPSVAKSTQYAADFSTLYQYQDGYATGFLEEITIGTDGIVYGHYTNGQTRELYQVVLANFVNPSGLIKRGGNLYEQSPYSGEPLIGLPGSAGLGTIVPNSLEQSNVDLAEEFTKIIVYQRAFQANARVVTTTDDMLGEVVNLRR